MGWKKRDSTSGYNFPNTCYVQVKGKGPVFRMEKSEANKRNDITFLSRSDAKKLRKTKKAKKTKKD